MKISQICGVLGIGYIFALVFYVAIQIGTAYDAYVIGWGHLVCAAIYFSIPFVFGYLFGRGKRKE